MTRLSQLPAPYTPRKTMTVTAGHRRALAVAAFISIPSAAGAQAVPAAPVMPAPHGSVVLAPFTLVVPVRFTTVHHDLKRLYIVCRILHGQRTMGTAEVYVGLHVDLTGSYSEDVTVPVFLNAGEDPIDAGRYECLSRISSVESGDFDAASPNWSLAGNGSKPWSRYKPGSQVTYEVRGTIPVPE